MNSNGYRISMEVFNTQEYQQFKQYFEALDSFSLSEAVIYIPEIAYLLIGEFPVLAENLDTKLEDILPGRNYRMDYIEGFREGVKHFNDKWTLTPDTLYGAESDHYFADLRAAYEGSGDQNTADGLLERWANPGWLFKSERIQIMINSEKMRETGYYAGLVFKYRELEKRHDRLRSKPEPKVVTDKRSKKPFRGTLEEACVNDKALKYVKYYFTEEKKCCDPEFFIFIKNKQMNIRWLAETLKGLKARGYTHKLTNEEIHSIMVNSFKADCDIETVKRTKPRPERIDSFLGNS